MTGTGALRALKPTGEGEVRELKLTVNAILAASPGCNSSSQPRTREEEAQLEAEASCYEGS